MIILQIPKILFKLEKMISKEQIVEKGESRNNQINLHSKGI